ncbi:MAG TPA: SIS domain-containing protein [Gemmatimonadales bacterium]|nr:SIS domain-containing protein [Gemmatimonadales bacterium]
MTDAAHIAAGLEALAGAARDVAGRAQELAPLVAAMRTALGAGGTLFFAGNGGSAADAQHLAAEYVVRFAPGQRRGLRAVALTTDSSILTAAANDFGFDRIFARQLEALGRPGDVLVVHSTSGSSANLVQAVVTARALGLVSVALLGSGGGSILPLVDHAFVVAGTEVARTQELHLAIQHRIAAILTAEFGA